MLYSFEKPKIPLRITITNWLTEVDSFKNRQNIRIEFHLRVIEYKINHFTVFSKGRQCLQCRKNIIFRIFHYA